MLIVKASPVSWEAKRTRIAVAVPAMTTLISRFSRVSVTDAPSSPIASRKIHRLSRRALSEVYWTRHFTAHSMVNATRVASTLQNSLSLANNPWSTCRISRWTIMTSVGRISGRQRKSTKSFAPVHKMKSQDDGVPSTT